MTKKYNNRGEELCNPPIDMFGNDLTVADSFGAARADDCRAHSPLPWRWLPEEGQFIVDAKGDIVAEVPCQGCNPINGSFLVKAVNQHATLLEQRAQLVEVLQAALKIVADRAAGGRMTTSIREADEVWQQGAKLVTGIVTGD